MTTTKTEELLGLLDYGLVSRQSTNANERRMFTGYTKALENLVVLYANQAKNGVYTAEEMQDFQDQVSLVSVLDNRHLYPGIDRLPAYCSDMFQKIKLEKSDEMVR